MQFIPFKHKFLKMKIKTEVKIGFIVLTTFLLVFWGINYLKGRNILNKTNVFYVVYNDVQGLGPSASVLLNGYKVGMINDISFKESSLTDIVVCFDIDHKFNIPLGSEIQLFSADLLGTKALTILPSSAIKFHEYGDTLKSSIKADLISSLSEEILPLKSAAEQVLVHIDSVVSSLDIILNSDTRVNIQESIAKLRSSTDAFDKQLNNGDLKLMLHSLAEFSKALDNNKEKLDTIFQNIESVSDSIASSNIRELLTSINSTFSNTNILLENVNKGEGTIGQFAQNDSLYFNLNASLESLNILLKDLEENPERYVQFSVFGKKDK